MIQGGGLGPQGLVSIMTMKHFSFDTMYLTCPSISLCVLGCIPAGNLYNEDDETFHFVEALMFLSVC